MCANSATGIETMRTTINLDDELLAKARARTEPMSHTRLMDMAFRTLVRRERGRGRFRLQWSQRARVPLAERDDLDPAVLRAMQAGDQQ